MKSPLSDAFRSSPKLRLLSTLGALVLLLVLLATLPSLPGVRFSVLHIPTAARAPVQAGLQRHVRDRKREEIHARFKQGVVMLQARQFDFAIQAFHRVLALDPGIPEAHANMGYAFLGKDDFPGAQRFFEGAIALRKNQLNAYYGLALAAAAQGKNGIAAGAMRTWVHLAPADDPLRDKAAAELARLQAALGAAATSPAGNPRSLEKTAQGK